MGVYDLHFDTVETPSEQRQLADFLRAHTGSYDAEAHERWIEEKCIPGIESGERSALAWWSHGQMIGDAVLKVVDPKTVELKNFRVARPDDLRIRGHGDFMIRAAKVEAQRVLEEVRILDPDTDQIRLILDTTMGNPAADFFSNHGFRVTGEVEGLYVPGQTELLMEAQVPLAA